MSISAPKSRKAKTPTSLLRVEGGKTVTKSDVLATEEPLEIRLKSAGPRPAVKTVAVTMRTPGHDFELAAGFLFSEGMLDSRADIRRIAYCTAVAEPQQYNTVNVELNQPELPELPSLDRHFFTSSACGVCGKSGLENLQLRCKATESDLTVKAEVLSSLPPKLRKSQAIFEDTGGLHAAALFDQEGNLLAVREDVGRHNAVDKLVGWALLEGKLPLEHSILLVSGRASYELAQKTVAAGIPVLAAVSAPSSLAVEVAQRFNLTLVGFLRESFNVYSGQQRIKTGSLV